MTPRFARVALAALLVAHAAIAWFPFRLDIPGYVAVDVERASSGTLVLGGQRIVARGAPPWAGGDLDEVGTVRVVLEVRPASASQDGPARILAVSGGHRDASLMIGQRGDQLVVRVRRQGSDAAGNPPLVAHEAFAPDRWTRVEVVVTGGHVAVEVDGRPAAEARTPGAPMRTWDPGHPLRVGDEAGGSRPWNGRIRRAEVTAGGRTVDYLEPAALDIPARTLFLPERLLESVATPSPHALLRSLLHLLGFVPVGALLVAARPTHVRLPAVGLLAAVIAVVLQGAKIVLDTRHPSLLTVATQTAGALAGAWLVLRFRLPRVRRSRG